MYSLDILDEIFVLEVDGFYPEQQSSFENPLWRDLKELPGWEDKPKDLKAAETFFGYSAQNQNRNYCRN